MIETSTASRFTASKGNTSLPELFGSILPLPWIFTDGSLFSEIMFEVKDLVSLPFHSFKIPSLMLTL
ncbi:MAG: hypothetical protein JWQ40_3776 [Segetibacter sp.]|nr:hypothetical protein [Segetibacter sp.]